MRIYLVGFMGSGKSFLGKKIAENLHFRFIDLDEKIESGEGKTVSQIFSGDGEQAFRRLEAKYLRNTGELLNTVIATGGGTPCFFENMEWMNQNGLTIYLKTTPELLAARLSAEKSNRPLISGLDEKNLLDFIQKKLSERAWHYEQAHFELAIRKNGSEVAKEISEYLKRFTGSKS